MRNYCLMGTEFQCGMMKMFSNWMVVMVANNMNVLNAPELNT